MCEHMQKTIQISSKINPKSIQNHFKIICSQMSSPSSPKNDSKVSQNHARVVPNPPKMLLFFQMCFQTCRSARPPSQAQGPIKIKFVANCCVFHLLFNGLCRCKWPC